MDQATSATAAEYVPYQPFVQLDSAALTRDKIKEVYGFAAFLQLGLATTQGAVKYRIEKKRIIPMKEQDYYTIPLLNVSTMSLSRKYHQASRDDLNFLSVEIPKFIRWYLWNADTQKQASQFVKKVCLEGLKHLRDVCYKTDTEVQQRITLWFDLMSMAVQEPIDNNTLSQKINLYLRTHSAYNEKIIEFTTFLNEVDLPFGLRIKGLITSQDLERINKLFNNTAIIRQSSIEEEINNAYTRYMNERRAATLQTISREIMDMHQMKPTEAQTISKKGSADFPRPPTQGNSPASTNSIDSTKTSPNSQPTVNSTSTQTDVNSSSNTSVQSAENNTTNASVQAGVSNTDKTTTETGDDKS